jgi:hypothetical protein
LLTRWMTISYGITDRPPVMFTVALVYFISDVFEL